MSDDTGSADALEMARKRDEALLAALASLGLRGEREGDAITTSVEHLVLKPQTILTGECGECRFVIEIETSVEDAKGNAGSIVQTVEALDGNIGETIEASLAEVAREWVQGALAPLCFLADAEHGVLSGKVKLESYRDGASQLIVWEGFLGEVQTRGVKAAQHGIRPGALFGLVQNTLLNHLKAERLHWMDVRGTRHADGTTSIRVEMDNQFLPKVSAGANAGFDWTTFPLSGSFRQFAVFHPVGTKPLAGREKQIENAQRQRYVENYVRTRQDSAAPPSDSPVPTTPPTATAPKFHISFGRKPKY